MFDIFRRRKKKGPEFSPRQQLERLTELSPPSTLVNLKDPPKNGGGDLGKAFFLRRDKKIYTDGDSIYLTTPENIKISKDQNLNSKTVSLQFFHRRVPHTLDCRIAGRYRLLPEVVETLDFSTKAAYKLVPIAPLKKQDKRMYLRYILKNYGDTRVPLTTHITFDVYIKKTSEEFPTAGAPPVLLNELKVIPFKEESNGQDFTTRDAINDFRDLMLKKQPHERGVWASKVIKDDAGGMVKRPDEELLLGQINILGLEMESLRDVLYLKKSEKAAIIKGQNNPYNLTEGEKLLTYFSHERSYYKMLCEVMEARTQNEVVRPLEFMSEEAGIQADLIDYSTGGCLIEAGPDFLTFMLGDKCPADVNDEPNFEAEYWEAAFSELSKQMIHLTFYPTLNFPDAVKQFCPELPFKIDVIGQVTRHYLHEIKEKSVLQLGLQFAYEPQQVPLQKDDDVNWRYSRHIKDNPAFKVAHSHLSQLYGFLENQSMTSSASSASSASTPRRQRKPADEGGEQQ